MDDQRRIYRKGSVYVEGDRIIDVGPSSKIQKSHSQADHHLDATGHIILPGLINAHCHSISTLRRFLGADLGILDWLKQCTWPFNAQLRAAETTVGARLGILENLRFGNTTIIDNYYPPASVPKSVDGIMTTAEEFGIRSIFARGCIDNADVSPLVFVESPKQIISEYHRLCSAFHGKANGRLQIAVSPVNLMTTTPTLLERLQEFAEARQLLFHTHVAEGKPEVDLVKEQYGKTYIDTFNDYGLLNERFHAAHGVWLAPQEIQLLADTHGTVVYNPASNMYLASGVCPIPALQQASVSMAVGTDGAATDATMDLLSHLNIGCLLQKVSALNPKILTAQQILEMATINGAQAIGRDHDLGSITPQKKADIITIDTRQPYLQPLHDPIAAVVYGAGGTDVDTVIIDGRIILQNKHFTSIDPTQVIQEATKTGYQIQAQLD